MTLKEILEKFSEFMWKHGELRFWAKAGLFFIVAFVIFYLIDKWWEDEGRWR